MHSAEVGLEAHDAHQEKEKSLDQVRDGQYGSLIKGISYDTSRKLADSIGQEQACVNRAKELGFESGHVLLDSLLAHGPEFSLCVHGNPGQVAQSEHAS